MILNLTLKISYFWLYSVYPRFGMSYHHEFLQKHFFWKVHIILNIFHIYHVALKWILWKLQAIEISWKNVILSSNLSHIFTSGLAEMTVGRYHVRTNRFSSETIFHFWPFLTFFMLFWAFFGHFRKNDFFSKNDICVQKYFYDMKFFSKHFPNDKECFEPSPNIFG